MKKVILGVLIALMLHSCTINAESVNKNEDNLVTESSLSKDAIIEEDVIENEIEVVENFVRDDKIESHVWENDFGNWIDFSNYPKEVEFQIPDFKGRLSQFFGKYSYPTDFLPYEEDLGECEEEKWAVGVKSLWDGNQIHYTHSGVCKWGILMGEIFRKPTELGPIGSKSYMDSYRNEHLNDLLGKHPCYNSGSGWVCFEIKEIRHYFDVNQVNLSDFDMSQRSILIYTCSSRGGIFDGIAESLLGEYVKSILTSRLIIRMEIAPEYVPDVAE